MPIQAIIVCALIAASRVSSATPQSTHDYHDGKATYYSPGLMEDVAASRGLYNKRAYKAGERYATYPDCSRIGGTIYVSVLDPRSEEWSGWSAKKIVDCSQPSDYARHIKEGLIELSYEDAVKYGYSGEGRTRIRFYLPDR